RGRLSSMKCPACGFDNLQGADDCVECYTSLTAESLSVPRGALSDPIKKSGLREPITVKPTTSVLDVVQLMKKKKMGCALVVENVDLLGMFTERDILRNVSDPNADLEHLEVNQVMTPAPEVLNETESISLALNKMAMGNYRHVPVRREDGSYTYFSVRDALR